MSPGRVALIVGLIVLAGPTGCGGGRAFIATPYLLQRPGKSYFADTPERNQAPEIEVLYATDRASAGSNEELTYGFGRSRRLAFGTATVGLDPAPTWKELVADSTGRVRQRHYTLKPDACQERGAFDPRWDKLQLDGDGVRLCGEAMVDLGQQRQAFHGLLEERLAGTTHKDVFVFVHGVNNSFDDTVFRAAEVWHFLGRVGVPIVYTWPAGYGGLRGYAYDRESGEFTVFHLKQFLKAVADCPGVERVHLIAHSRGCDVAISALRELHIACHAQGKSTRETLKMENLVLAAPDLDEDVFLQRFIAENLLSAAHRTTIYTSPRDRVIELADLIFASRRRLGQLGPKDFSPQVRQGLAKLPNLQFIECAVTHFSTSHDYVFAHPAALSDLLLLLRDRLPPGAEHGRPLRQPVEGIWAITNDYLR